MKFLWTTIAKPTFHLWPFYWLCCWKSALFCHNRDPIISGFLLSSFKEKYLNWGENPPRAWHSNTCRLVEFGENGATLHFLPKHLGLVGKNLNETFEDSSFSFHRPLQVGVTGQILWETALSQRQLTGVHILCKGAEEASLGTGVAKLRCWYHGL